MENCPTLNVWTPDTHTIKVKTSNTNTKYCLLTITLIIILLSPVLLAKSKQPIISSQPQILSSAASTQQNSETVKQFDSQTVGREEQGNFNPEQNNPVQTSLYYITTSQEFLNRARTLAENNSQTPEDKQQILDAVKQSLVVINQGVKNYPQDDRIFFQRASIYEAVAPFMTNSLSLAIQDLNSAIRNNSGNPAYYQKLAFVYSKSGDLNRAASTLYSVYLLNPTDTQTVYTLADTLERLGDLSRADYYFQKLISLLPQNDTNLTTIRQRQEQLSQKIKTNNLTYITDPNQAKIPDAFSPVPSEAPFGLEELPLEQASLASNVIIAGNNETPPANSESQTNINGLHGTAIIPAGQTETTVSSKQVTDNSFVSLKPQASTKNRIVSVSERQAGGYFKIGLNSATDIDIKVEWWISE